MYKHILVTLDGVPASEQALRQAIFLAKLSGARLSGISVIEKLPAYAASLGEVEEARAEAEAFFNEVQSNAVKAARSMGVAIETVIRAGQPVKVILEYAEEVGFDLLVVGAKAADGLGGTADKIVDHAPCSVLVARSALSILRVQDVMTSNVSTVESSVPLSEVFDLLLRQQLKAVPVVEDKLVIGIITGGDLLDRAGLGLRLSLQRLLPTEKLEEQKKQLAASGKTAGEIMTTPVYTIGQDERVSRAARIMIEKGIKRLPVLDKSGSLVGIISRLDVICTLASGARSEDVIPNLPIGVYQTAADIMFKDIETVSPHTPLNEVVNKIVSTSLRRVVVTDEANRVLGIISDSDLLKRLSRHALPGALEQLIAHFSRPKIGKIATTLSGTAFDVMEKEIFTIHPETPLSEIVQVMTEKRVKRLVVVDQGQRLAGMVDRESILRMIAG
jgi:CBS domain-containing protein